MGMAPCLDEMQQSRRVMLRSQCATAPLTAACPTVVAEELAVRCTFDPGCNVQDDFIPERWIAGTPENEKRPKDAWAAFGEKQDKPAYSPACMALTLR